MPKILTNRKILLKASLKVFLKNGYYHTSFQDLAKACNIKKSHFYYYFSNKEDLMKEVLVYAHTYVKQKIFSLADQENKSAKEKLNDILNQLKQLYYNHHYGCLMGNTLLELSGKEPNIEKVITSYFDDFKQTLTSIYKDKNSSEAPEILANDTIAKLHGNIMFMKLYKDHSYLENAARQILEQF
ncbi:TetR/AcrR family transcriptional regulator [Chondrinema litorale]|uniref:TetR/AcrR family transcriptional regulator n=1 Tax=Chondrinema litorale TaxID=2994555 RepID=UPI002542CA97|nr:TetR/AcrR family transcriptional regulator [Chondrinema litorale]UZR97314.1 TetR/AcrR family transcriptional regulator [Chondrinema litorale]